MPWLKSQWKTDFHQHIHHFLAFMQRLQILWKNTRHKIMWLYQIYLRRMLSMMLCKNVNRLLRKSWWLLLSSLVISQSMFCYWRWNMKIEVNLTLYFQSFMWRYTSMTFMAAIHRRFKYSGLEELVVASGGIVEPGSVDQALNWKRRTT